MSAGWSRLHGTTITGLYRSRKLQGTQPLAVPPWNPRPVALFWLWLLEFYGSGVDGWLWAGTGDVAFQRMGNRLL
jgi:hypothetical protein